jgi:plasmid stabilization system protein ParE
MRRRLDVTPQARRDVESILAWYRTNVGARAALKVAQTIRSRLNALESGRARGAALAGGSRHQRVIAKKHVLIFLVRDDTIMIVRVVHGSQDLEAIAAALDDSK